MLTCRHCGDDYPDGTAFCPKDGAPLTAPSPDLVEGQSVGEFRVTGKLGQGGMGAVFAGVQPVIGKRVAIKVLNRELARDNDMIQRFIREARAVNHIGHPNIIDAFSFGELPDGRVYYVMELLEGESLNALLERRRLTLAEVRRLVGQTLDALAAAHAEGIVHRDLKPDNIYVATPRHGEPFVKLLDFGIAKLYAADDAVSATKTGMPIGTPYYMSPEQVRGLKDVDHRTDIYAMGCILFEIFTGKLPFVRPTAFEVFYDHMNTPPRSPSTLRPMPAALAELILQCLAKEPAARPQSAKTLRDELDRILTEHADGVAAALAAAAGGLLPHAVPVNPHADTGAATHAIAAPASSDSVGPTVARALAPVPDPSERDGSLPPTAASLPPAVERSGELPPVQPRRSPALLLGVVGLVVVGGAIGGVMLLRGGDRSAAAGGAAPPPVPARRPGVIRVSTDAPIARFSLDGKAAAQGKTAVITEVAPGLAHELRVEVEGRPPKLLQVQVAEGGESVVEVSFADGAQVAPPAPSGPAVAPKARPPAGAKVAEPKPPAPAKAAAPTPKTDAPPEPKPEPKKPKPPKSRDDTADPFG